VTVSAIAIVSVGVRMGFGLVAVRAGVGMLVDELGAVTMAVAAQRFIGEELGHQPKVASAS
jgi:hypothetical protein